MLVAKTFVAKTKSSTRTGLGNGGVASSCDGAPREGCEEASKFTLTKSSPLVSRSASDMLLRRSKRGVV